MEKFKTYSLSLCSVILMTFFTNFYAQVGINTSSPYSSAILELSSSNKALLLTRVSLLNTLDNTTVPNPIAGMIILNTSNAGTGGTAVTANTLYQWIGTEWAALVNNKSLPSFNIPTQILSINVPGTQNIGSGSSTGVVQLTVENRDIYNAWNSNIFTVPITATYIVNYQSSHFHTPEANVWYVILSFEKSVDGGANWTQLINDTRSGLQGVDGGNSNILFWTGNLNANDLLRVRFATSASTPNIVSNGGIAITKL